MSRAAARRAGVDVGNNPLAFDQAQMRVGFNAGDELAKSEKRWVKRPDLSEFPAWIVEGRKDG